MTLKILLSATKGGARFSELEDSGQVAVDLLPLALTPLHPSQKARICGNLTCHPV